MKGEREKEGSQETESKGGYLWAHCAVKLTATSVLVNQRGEEEVSILILHADLKDHCWDMGNFLTQGVQGKEGMQPAGFCFVCRILYVACGITWVK